MNSLQSLDRNRVCRVCKKKMYQDEEVLRYEYVVHGTGQSGQDRGGRTFIKYYHTVCMPKRTQLAKRKQIKANTGFNNVLEADAHNWDTREIEK